MQEVTVRPGGDSACVYNMTAFSVWGEVKASRLRMLQRVRGKDCEEEAEEAGEARPAYHKARHRHSARPRDMIDLCRDERGRWRWPTNGADLVYPGIYLGDESTALCTGWGLSCPPSGCELTPSCQDSQGSGSHCSAQRRSRQSGRLESGEYQGGFLSTPRHPVPGRSWRGPQQFSSGGLFLRSGWLHRSHPERGGESVCSLCSGGSSHKQKDHLSLWSNYFQGISRSATLVLAFLIIKRKIRLEEAIKSISVKRSIAPNEGFMLQLIELNDEVHKLLWNAAHCLWPRILHTDVYMYVYVYVYAMLL